VEDVRLIVVFVMQAAVLLALDGLVFAYEQISVMQGKSPFS
jgi:hypothetical protein